MNKIAVVLVSMVALLFGACSQIPGLVPTPATSPTMDTTAISDALFQTAVAQTLTARPSLPPASPVVATTDTPTLVASPTLPPTETPVASQTFTPGVDLTAAATGTGNVVTATFGPPLPTATLAVGQVTEIPTLTIRLYGTLPPAVPFSQVTLINKARTEAYISLQVTMPDGTYSILEYPVEGRVEIKAPIGSYLYVAWVGGRKMVGEFKLKHNDDVSILLYRDHIEIK
jgi:hypothetical protein